MMKIEYLIVSLTVALSICLYILGTIAVRDRTSSANMMFGILFLVLGAAMNVITILAIMFEAS